MQTLQFKTAADFRRWLEKNHADSEGIWLRIFKKNSGRPSLTYPEALDEALCHGWIDGLKKSYDESSWTQRFTRRRPRSGWSKLNAQRVERLVKAGVMTPAGMEAVEAAKADVRWQAAYSAPRDARVPKACLDALRNNKKA